MYDDKMIEMSRVVYLFDLLITNIAFVLAIWGRQLLLPDGNIDFYTHLYILPLLLFFTIGFFFYTGVYSNPRYTTLIDFAKSIFKAVVLSIGTMLTLLFFLKVDFISRAVILNFSVIEFFLVFTYRGFIKSHYEKIAKDGSGALHVLIIGTGERAKELSAMLREKAELGIKIIGHLDPDPSCVGSTVLDVPVIGVVDDISSVLEKNVVDEVIIAIPRTMLQDAEPIAHACEEEGIKLRLMADVFNLNTARIRLKELGKTPLLTLEPVAQDEIKLLVKRIFDFAASLTLLIIALPVMVIVAIAIKLDSTGPILFVQQRVGLNKRRFPMFKFRSMCADAES